MSAILVEKSIPSRLVHLERHRFNLVLMSEALDLLFGRAVLVVNICGSVVLAGQVAWHEEPVGGWAHEESSKQKSLEQIDRCALHDSHTGTDTNQAHGNLVINKLRSQISVVVVSQKLVNQVVAQKQGATVCEMRWHGMLHQPIERVTSGFGTYLSKRPDQARSPAAFISF